MENKISRSATESYRSYLLRCWFSPGQPPRRRFVVETVSNAPRRRGFDTFDELVAFLQVELLEDGGIEGSRE